MILGHVQYEGGALVTRISERAETDLVHRRERCLGRREKGREHQKNDQYDKLKSVTRVHCSFFTPFVNTVRRSQAREFSDTGTLYTALAVLTRLTRTVSLLCGGAGL